MSNKSTLVSQEILDGLEALHEDLVSSADPERARQMAAYMKDRFQFLGLPKPLRADLQQPYFKEYRSLGLTAAEMLQYGWQREEREWQYIAMDYALKQSKYQSDDWPILMEHCITAKSWWDTVDALAAHGVGDWVLRHPEQGQFYIAKWRDSSHMWLQRTTIIHQLFFKEETDIELLFGLCLQYKDAKAFFIQKAMGWALRQFARTDAEAVYRFVSSIDLPSLTKREALKHIEKPFYASKSSLSTL